MTEQLKQKYQGLQAQLKELSPLAVAYSGGVDSALLLKACADTPGVEAIAILALMPFNARWEQENARSLADELQVRLIEVEMDVLESPRIAKNSRERCYFCKRGLFGHVLKVARAYGMQNIIDGTNGDDVHTLRPGIQAAEEFGVYSPLRDQGFTKREVRELSAGLGLKYADRPQSACLATRIPYGTAITLELLRRIERSEDYLRELGFTHVRVRLHGYVTRIEIPAADIPRFAKLNLPAVCEILKSYGNGYITLDLQGLRSGSMDEMPD